MLEKIYLSFPGLFLAMALIVLQWIKHKKFLNLHTQKSANTYQARAERGLLTIPYQAPPIQLGP